MQSSLTALFLRDVTPAARDQIDVNVLGAQLAVAWREARASWPELAVSATTMLPYAGERLALSLQSLSAESLSALYLTCACVHGDPRAHALLETRYLTARTAVLGRMNLTRDQLDEVQQQVRIHLLIGSAGARPKIADYTGRGKLSSWIATVATRIALRLIRGQPPRGGDEAVLAALPSPDRDAELGYIQRAHSTAFRAAFGDALAGLPVRELNLLKLHYIEGLRLDDIGTIYGAHRVTICRWLAAARQLLLERTRAALVGRLQLTRAECDSLLRIVQSRLDFTLQHFFRSAPPRPC